MLRGKREEGGGRREEGRGKREKKEGKRKEGAGLSDAYSLGSSPI